MLGPLELVENGRQVELAGGRPRRRRRRHALGRSLDGNQVRQIDADDYQLRQVIQCREGSRPWSVALALGYGHGFLWVSLHDRPLTF